MTTNLMSCCPSLLMPRQISEKDVFQYVGNLVSVKSNPVVPPAGLKAALLCHRSEEYTKFLWKRKMFTRRQSEIRSPGITVKVRALAFHYFGLGSIPCRDDVCRLSWWVLDSENIFRVFLSLSKPIIHLISFIWSDNNSISYCYYYYYYHYYYYYCVNNKMLEYDWQPLFMA